MNEWIGMRENDSEINMRWNNEVWSVHQDDSWCSQAWGHEVTQFINMTVDVVKHEDMK